MRVTMRRSPNGFAAQDELARSHLAGLPNRDRFRQRLAALLDHARLTAPEKRDDRYFFTRNPGLDDQEVLVMREGLDGADRVLIDPNTWSDDGAAALAEWAVSEDGPLRRLCHARGRLRLAPPSASLMSRPAKSCPTRLPGHALPQLPGRADGSGLFLLPLSAAAGRKRF